MLLAACAPMMGCAAEQTDTESPLEPSFTLAIIADTHISGNPDNEERLGRAVSWLNEHAQERQIELVAVLGDIGWGAGLARSKELLDGLQVPYVPLRGDNELHAGDELAFAELFQPQYEALAQVVDDWRTPPPSVHDPKAQQEIWLNNAAFRYRGLQLFMLDFCVRGDESVLSEFGELHDYPDGTWHWFASELDAIHDMPLESVVLLSHIPMFRGPFDAASMDRIHQVVTPHGAQVYANLAGHLHNDSLMEEEGFDVYVTDATFDDDVTIRLVTVLRNETRFGYAHELITVP